MSDELGKNMGSTRRVAANRTENVKKQFGEKSSGPCYLFEGMRGTGKREIGLLLTKALFCESLLMAINHVRHVIIADELIVAIIQMFIM